MIVIPSGVEESLAISEILRDVSASLDMTETRGSMDAAVPLLKLWRGLFVRQSLRTEIR